MAKATTKSTEIEIVRLKQGEATFCLIGESPFIFNRMAEKAKRELLMPRGRLTSAQKANNLKHNPVEEFRNSVYRDPGNGPTRLVMKATAFKGALASAATDMPTSVAKAQINRLVYVVGETVPIWGVPRLNMDVVRSADMNKTPDIRTRAKLMEWATVITLRYAEPMLNEHAVGNLLAAAGIQIGVGDFRQEKGKGSHGQFRQVNMDDPDFQRIMRDGGRAVQDEALANPVCSDQDSEELLEWFNEELNRRGVALPNTVEDEEGEEELLDAAE